VSVDVRCRTHLCPIAVIVRDPDGMLVLETAPETAARGYARMRWVVPWTGDGWIPQQWGYGCPRGHAERKGTPWPLSYEQIRKAWQTGKTLIWP
jgi:hypothetical protein